MQRVKAATKVQVFVITAVMLDGKGNFVKKVFTHKIVLVFLSLPYVDIFVKCDSEAKLPYSLIMQYFI